MVDIVVFVVVVVVIVFAVVVVVVVFVVIVAVAIGVVLVDVVIVVEGVKCHLVFVFVLHFQLFVSGDFLLCCLLIGQLALVPNCPRWKFVPGAKLSSFTLRYQIVPGAKLY